MALTSTLFIGLSGLNVNQTRLNVVGNNIANVNTVAFKASRALFKPQFYVTDAAGAPAGAEFGGQNPSQRGLGATVSTIEKNFAPGAIEPTGRLTDFAIDGAGFFIVQGADRRYTRDGSFVLNAANELVTSRGAFVQGYSVDENGTINTGTLGNIIIPLGTSTVARATSNLKLEGNLNASGDVAAGASIFNSGPLVARTGAVLGTPPESTLLTDLADQAAPGTALFAVGDVLTVAGSRGGRDTPPQTLSIDAGTSLADLTEFMRQGLQIDTSVPDDGNPATPEAGIVVSNAGGVLTLTVTGNRGDENALDLNAGFFVNQSGAIPFSFTEDAASDPSGESVFTSFVVYDSLGSPLTVNVTMALESKSDAGNTWRFYVNSGDDTDLADPAAGNGAILGTGTVTFDTDGRVTASTGDTIQLNRAATGAQNPLAFDMDLSTLTSLASQRSAVVMTEQDGAPIGLLSTFSVGANGVITGTFTNGQTRALGQLALATFANPQGLQDTGGNELIAGANSGVPVITTPASMDAGAVRSGSLELSNVDLSAEFINLIIASTGFSSASRVISTSNQLLNELLATSR